MLNKEIKNSSLYVVQIVINLFFTLVLMGVMTRKLTPDDLGQFFLIQIYTGFAVGVANFGVQTGYERNFFQYEKSNIQSAQLIATAQLFVLCNLLLLAFIVYIYQISICNIIVSNKTPSSLLFIVLIATCISSLSQYYLSFFKNSGFVRSYVFFTIFQTAIYFSVSILLLFLSNLKVLSLAYAMLISNAIIYIVLYRIVSKKLPHTFNLNILKELLKISFPLTPNVFFAVLGTQFDKIILGLISSTEIVGVYSIGQKISYVIFQFMSGLGRVFQPEVYRKLFAKKQQMQVDDIHNYILPFFYATIFMALLVVSFAKDFVTLYFPKEYLSATIVILILSIYYSVLFFGKITGTQLIYAKKTFLSSLLMLVGIIINVALSIPLTLKWGMVGAAWATTISGIILGIISYFIAQRYVKIIWKWHIIWPIYAVFSLGIVFALLDYSKLINLNNYMSITFKILILFAYILLGFKIKILTKARFLKCLIK